TGRWNVPAPRLRSPTAKNCPPATGGPTSLDVAACVSSSVCAGAEGPLACGCPSHVMDIGDIACDRLKCRQRRHALHIRSHGGILSHGVDVLRAFPLQIVDNVSTARALVSTRRNVTRHGGHQRFRALFEELDEWLLMRGFNSKNVDQSDDFTGRA